MNSISPWLPTDSLAAYLSNIGSTDAPRSPLAGGPPSTCSVEMMRRAFKGLLRDDVQMPRDAGETKLR